MTTDREPDRALRLARALGRLRDGPRWPLGVFVAAGLAGGWYATSAYELGGPPWLVLPIVVAAFGFGLRGALATAVIGAVLASPLLSGTPVGGWVAVSTGLLVVAGVVGLLADALYLALQREARVAERERELSTQQAAIIQTVSHEFRTPLTIITGVAQTLARPDLREDERQRLTAALGRAGQRLDEMVSLVMAAADATEADLVVRQERVALDDLVRRVLERMHGREVHRVRVDLPPRPRTIVTAPEVVGLALTCLIDNALKFSPSREPVDVAVAEVDDDIIFEVRDRGPGIAPDMLEQLFRPFAQLDSSEQREHGGLGLGLFAARRIARRLGGHLWLRPGDDGVVAVLRIPQRRTGDRTGHPRDELF